METFDSSGETGLRRAPPHALQSLPCTPRNVECFAVAMMVAEAFLLGPPPNRNEQYPHPVFEG